MIVFYRSPRARIGCEYVTCPSHVTTVHTSHTNNTTQGEGRPAQHVWCPFSHLLREFGVGPSACVASCVGSLIVVPLGSSILKVQLRRHLPGVPPKGAAGGAGRHGA
eukprot:6356887-Prymnesium_polylepis.1